MMQRKQNKTKQTHMCVRAACTSAAQHVRFLQRVLLRSTLHVLQGNAAALQEKTAGDKASRLQTQKHGESILDMKRNRRGPRTAEQTKSNIIQESDHVTPAVRLLS